MAALRLHHAIFTKENDSDLPLRSASTFLHTAPERDGSPTNQLFTSAVYQDLIQRQPTHPDGPMSGWDLGLNLLGDPITAAEHKSLEDHQIKMKLRRLHAINIAFELLFGIWATYTTVRYYLAAADGLGDSEGVCALVLGIVSTLSVVLVIISILMPLFPRQTRPHIWRYARSLCRACYLLLLCSAAVMNLVLVLIWHPSQFCNWDIDASWYTSNVNTATSPCKTVSFAAWTITATLRVVVTLTLVLLFIFTLYSYRAMRHPNSNGISPKYTPFLPSDPEDIISPVSPSSPVHLSKSPFRLTLSEDSSRTLNQSNATLPKSNSISTLAPSTCCTGHSRSHSTPPPKDISPPRISPPTSRGTSAHATNCGRETPSQTQSAPLSASHMLRRTNRISLTQVTSDTMLSDNGPPSERSNGDAATVLDPSEIRSLSSWKPGHRGAGAHLDVKKTTLTWENMHARHTSQASIGPESLSSTHDDGESIKEMGKDDDALVYSYGYGASGPTYPYLDMYNPQRPGGYAEAQSSHEDADEHGFSHGYQRTIPSGPALSEVTSEPRSSLSEEEVEEEESSGEEYVAMMGGFVRRMATIESLGSKEAAGTLSTSGSVALHSTRSKTPISQFSSVQFAEQTSTGTSSLGIPLSRDGSHSTTYFSFSSGGTGMRANERGELLPPSASRSGASSPYDPQFYTASSSSFPRTDEEGR